MPVVIARANVAKIADLIVTMVPEPVLIASARPNYLTMCYRFNTATGVENGKTRR